MVRSDSGSSLVSLQPPSLMSARPVKSLCKVCVTAVFNDEMRGCSGCRHRYCIDCLDTFWTSCIFSGQHAELRCMKGGCAITATEADVRAVVTTRTYARMQYFRSRDAHKNDPNVRWCSRDGCWSVILERPLPNSSHVVCPSCSQCVCYKCGNPHDLYHTCPEAKRTSASALNACSCRLWAAIHTKSCPQCHARIQRTHGCSHMTCSRCAAYFCWRCRGFLQNGAPLPGRACVCDRIAGAALYTGLVVFGIASSPAILAVAVVGSAPYALYRLSQKRRSHRDSTRSEMSSKNSHPREILRTDEDDCLKCPEICGASEKSLVAGCGAESGVQVQTASNISLATNEFVDDMHRRRSKDAAG